MQNKKIMICDDDPGILDVLEMVFELNGYLVIKENESTKLMGRIKSEKPDVLLLDLWMPVISGDGIIKAIRLDPELRNLLIIAISASQDGKEIAMSAGADEFINKPFDIDLIIASVERKYHSTS